MAPKKEPQKEKSKYAYLLTPARDVVANFSIDILAELNEYLAQILEAEENEDTEGVDNYQKFNFTEASMLVQGTTMVYSRKVDYVSDQVHDFLDVLKSSNPRLKEDGDAAKIKKARKKRGLELGPVMFELEDFTELKESLYEKATSFERETKKTLDDLRCITERKKRMDDFQRNQVRKPTPSHFSFGKMLVYPFARSQQLVMSSKKRPDAIGRVADFETKKAQVTHDEQVIVIRDVFAKNINEFNLPGAICVPSNKDLSAQFGMAELHHVLDRMEPITKPDANGPFRDPLTDRTVVPPPQWYIDQEAERQKAELRQRPSTSTFATAAHSPSTRRALAARSSNYCEEPRNLQECITLIEKMEFRQSTRLTTFKATQEANESGDDFGDAMDDDGSFSANKENVGDVREGARAKRKVEPEGIQWQLDLDVIGNFELDCYDPEQAVSWAKKPRRDGHTPSTTSALACVMKKKNKKKTMEEKMTETRTYMHYEFYLHGKGNQKDAKGDWAVNALHKGTMQHQKEKVQNRLEKLRMLREQAKAKKISMDQQHRRSAALRISGNDVDALLDKENENAPGSRRTLGVADDDFDDNESMAIEFDGDNEDDGDVLPMHEVGPELVAETTKLRFADLSDDEIEAVNNLPKEFYLAKAVPILKRITEKMTKNEWVAYGMMQVYTDEDAAKGLQTRVDEWQDRLEPVLEEELERKEFDIHDYGSELLERFNAGQTNQEFAALVAGKKWYEISRYFLSCLLMTNTKNVKVSVDERGHDDIFEGVELDDDVNLKDFSEPQLGKMSVALLTKNRHHEVFAKEGAM